MQEMEEALNVIDRFLGRGEPPAMEAIFDPSFLAQIPEAQLRQIFGDLRAQLGACTGHRLLDKPSSHAWRARWSFESGFRIDGVLGLSEATPARIVMLHFDVPGREEDSWQAIEEDARALPGLCSLELRELATGRVLVSLEPSLRLGIGSTSKLVIFSCLLDRIAAGRLAWSHRIELEARAISGSSGVMHCWPVGSPLTVHTAAVLMLTMSDNTAADLLLHELGREAVEEVAGEIATPGSAARARFPSTRAFLKLAACSAAQQAEYRDVAPEQQLPMLERLESAPPELGDVTSQALPDGVGWYFSALEICNLLERIRSQIEDDEVARALLGASPQAIAAPAWAYVGSKGGSSPGRFSLAALLRSPKGRWLGACLTINTEPEAVSVPAYAGLIRRATDLALEDAG